MIADGLIPMAGEFKKRGSNSSEFRLIDAQALTASSDTKMLVRIYIINPALKYPEQHMLRPDA